MEETSLQLAIEAKVTNGLGYHDRRENLALSFLYADGTTKGLVSYLRDLEMYTLYNYQGEGDYRRIVPTISPAVSLIRAIDQLGFSIREISRTVRENSRPSLNPLPRNILDAYELSEHKPRTYHHPENKGS